MTKYDLEVKRKRLPSSDLKVPCNRIIVKIKPVIANSLATGDMCGERAVPEREVPERHPVL
jgi:hypothetical protein